MAYKSVQRLSFYRLEHLRTAQTGASCLAFYHGSEETYEEEPLSSEWYEKALLKMKKSSHSLKDMDLIDGRLINITDHSIYVDDRLEHRMRTFKSITRTYIGCQPIQETMKKNVMASMADAECKPTICFSKQSEREPLTLNSLSKVCNILNISVQQRKLIRLTICPQITKHQIWTGALEEILNGLKSEMEDSLKHHCSRKGMKMGLQIVVSCLKFLNNAISYDPESTSWMRLSPAKAVDSTASHKWEDVLAMFNDLINCLRDGKDLFLHYKKLEVMKEGLSQIKDVLIDKNIGYKEIRHQESLVQKKLTKTLGHSSHCLFTLLLYYLHGRVRDIEVDLCGGVYVADDGKSFCLYMGKILTSDEDRMVWSGVKQLDRALGLFKFVWETAGIKEVLELQGHLWCVGAKNRSLRYRGNLFFVHGIGLHPQESNHNSF